MTKFTIFAGVCVIIYTLNYLLLIKKARSKKIGSGLNRSNLDLISSSVINKSFLVLSYLNEKTIIKPLQITNDSLIAYCYLKNIEREFKIIEVKDIVIKETAFSIEYSYYDDGIENIKEVLNKASSEKQFVCIKYQRPSKPDLQINSSTGRRYYNGLKRGEISIRTINDIKASTNSYNTDNDYITAYCNTKNEERTFKVKRIKKVSILNL